MTAPDRALTSTAAADERERRWSALLPILRCPTCHASLEVYRPQQYLGCKEHRYPIRSGVPLLLSGSLLETAQAWQPARQGFRQRVWRWIPGPTAEGRQLRRLRGFLAALPADARVLNVGSGSWDLGPQILNVDLYPFAGVDVVADIHQLPFVDGSVDAIVCTGALEHVHAPDEAVAEFFRVLKSPRGKIFCTVPFLQAYHEDPVDLQRWTVTGVHHLFRDFARRDVRPSHGPGSAFTWVGAEYFATLLSLGNARLHTLWLMFFRWLFAPFKWTDAVSEGWDIEHRVSAGLLIVAEKA